MSENPLVGGAIITEYPVLGKIPGKGNVGSLPSNVFRKGMPVLTRNMFLNSPEMAKCIETIKHDTQDHYKKTKTGTDQDKNGNYFLAAAPIRRRAIREEKNTRN